MSGSAANIYAYLSEFHNNAQRSRAIMGKFKLKANSIYDENPIQIPNI